MSTTKKAPPKKGGGKSKPAGKSKKRTAPSYVIVYPFSGTYAHRGTFSSAKSAKDFKESNFHRARGEKAAEVMTEKQWEMYLAKCQNPKMSQSAQEALLDKILRR